MEATMQVWAFAHFPDYYDDQRERLVELPARLSHLGTDERAAALATVRTTVAGLVQAMSDELLQKAAISVADDLYKSAARRATWDAHAADYVGAAVGTFFAALGRRGYRMHYVVENTFPDDLQRPLQGLGMIAGAAGMIYICPHDLAARLLGLDGGALGLELDTLRPAVAEGRHLALELAERCVAGGRHVLYLEIDWDEGCLDGVMQLGAQPGVISAFRNDPPVPGSTVSVRFPAAPGVTTGG
jgi:hypothetical protein